ncbi:MAG: hypothetical protein M3P33_01585 [bacterium]|nr:hypothetical protein [bacterium]
MLGGREIDLASRNIGDDPVFPECMISSTFRDGDGNKFIKIELVDASKFPIAMKLCDNCQNYLSNPNTGGGWSTHCTGTELRNITAKLSETTFGAWSKDKAARVVAQNAPCPITVANLIK